MEHMTLVIFGGTGDLAQHKLFPALHTLYVQKKLPEDFSVIGFSRRELSNEAYREFIGESLKEDAQEFLSHVTYQQGEFDTKSGYEALHQTINLRDGNHIF